MRIETASHDRATIHLNFTFPLAHFNCPIAQRRIFEVVGQLKESRYDVACRFGVAVKQRTTEVRSVGHATIGATILRALQPLHRFNQVPIQISIGRTLVKKPTPSEPINAEKSPSFE